MPAFSVLVPKFLGNGLQEFYGYILVQNLLELRRT
jgi:hypothetical protein